MPGKTADPPALTTLIALSGLSVVSLNMFLPSLANIAHEFQADYALVNLCIAVYAAVSAVLQLVMGPLSDRFGRRPVILAALLLFLVASLGCLAYLVLRVLVRGRRREGTSGVAAMALLVALVWALVAGLPFFVVAMMLPADCREPRVLGPWVLTILSSNSNQPSA